MRIIIFVINPNKAGLFEVGFFWGEGFNLTRFVFQEELT